MTNWNGIISNKYICEAEQQEKSEGSITEPLLKNVQLSLMRLGFSDMRNNQYVIEAVKYRLAVYVYSKHYI